MIRVQMLGRFAIFAPDGEIMLPTAKVRMLAAYLFWRQGIWVRRDILRGMLWGDSDENKAAGSLRTALYHLRKALNNGSAPDTILEVRQDSVRVMESANLCIDAHVFEEQCKEGQGTTTDIKPLVAAASIYRGEFVDDLNDDWCLTERRRLSDMHIGILRELTIRLTGSGLYQAAVSYAHRWIAANPLDEEAYQALMRLYGAMGQPARVVEQFEHCKRVFETELGISPSDSTIRLYRELGLSVVVNNSTKLDSGRDGKRRRLTTKAYVTTTLSDDPLRNAGLMLIYGEDKALRGDIAEGIEAIKKAVEAYELIGTEEQRSHARLVMGSAFLYTPLEPDAEKALAYVEPALAYLRNAGPSSSLCRALLLAADSCWSAGRNKEALAYAQEGQELASLLKDKDCDARFAFILGLVHTAEYRLGAANLALEKAVQSLTCFTEIQYALRVVLHRGILAIWTGELHIAERFLHEALAISCMVTPSPKVEQSEYLTRALLMLVLYFQDKHEDIASLCPPLDAGKYDPTKYISYLIPLFLPNTDIKATLKDVDGWLRASLADLPSHFIVPHIRLLVEQMLAVGFDREAAQWAAVGIRYARTVNWPGYASLLYAHRSVALIRQGKIKGARLCRRRSQEAKDAADKLTPAWLAYADGLIALSEADEDTAMQHIASSIALFREIGDRYRVRLIENETNNKVALPATTSYSASVL